MKKFFSGMTERTLGRLSGALLWLIFAVCVVTGDNWLSWGSWFIGVACGVSLWQLIFKR